MIIEGYRYGANFDKASRVIVKHTNISMNDAVKLCNQLKNGVVITLPDDFVLREDLEDLKFIIK
jgi:hypothetical protein